MASVNNSNKNSATAYDAFNAVDDMVAKPVLGSDGAGRWQDFQKNNQSIFVHANHNAPKAPLKQVDRLNSGYNKWNDERKNEYNIRELNGQTNIGSYTHFKRKRDDSNNNKDDDNDADTDIMTNKEKKRIELRRIPNDKEYYIPSKTFQGWKWDYIFTTRPDYGTGYYFDGMDSYKKLHGITLPEYHDDSNNNNDNNVDSNDSNVKKKKSKQKIAGPIIVDNTNHPMEQVAAALLRRKQQYQQQKPPLMNHSINSNKTFIENKPFIHDAKQHDEDNEWHSAVDPVSDRTYYYNHKTGTTTWEKPTPSFTSSTNNNGSRVNSNAATTAATTTTTAATTTKTSPSNMDDPSTGSTIASSPLPEGWNSTIDPKTGRLYYYHTLSGETRWDHP